MSEYLEIALAVVFFVFLFQYFHSKNSILTNWPILGMLPSLCRNVQKIHDFATEILIQTGGTFEFKGPWLANMDYMVTCDPDNFNHAVAENFDNFPKGSEFAEIFDPVGDGILTADKASWKLQRKLIQSSLSKDNVLHFLKHSIKAKVADGLIPLLDLASMESEAIDLQQVFHQFAFDNICFMVMGVDPGSLLDRTRTVKYQEAFGKMVEAILCRNVSPPSFWKLQRWLHVGTEKQLSEAMKTLDPFLYEGIASQRAALEKSRKEGEAAPSTMLAAFIYQQEHNNGGQIRIKGSSSRFLRDIALNLMLAGRDTVSSCLTWFFWLVGTHPLVEKKILQEIEENFQAKDKENKDSVSWFLSVCNLDGLVYLQAALCETLRLYPPIPFNRRSAIVPSRLPSGHVVKKTLVLSLYAMGRMEYVWGADCLEFKPERWISEQGRIIHVPSNKFASFHAGPRACLGKTLSFTQMKMVAASMLWNFHVQMIEGHPVLPSCSIAMSMKHGLKVRISKRRTSNN